MSNSHISCCVPKCNQKGTVGPDGRKVGFFSFPKDKNLKKVWIAKIRRDEGKDFEVKDDTKVCSLLFDQSEISKGFGRKMSLKRRSEVFPTKFASPLEGDKQELGDNFLIVIENSSKCNIISKFTETACLTSKGCFHSPKRQK